MQLNPTCFLQHSLAVLMEKMFAASPHFVRCIKPNGSKLPDQVDSKLIMDQVNTRSLALSVHTDIVLNMALSHCNMFVSPLI